MYFSGIRTAGSGPMFNLSIKKHNEYYLSLGKEPLHPEVNINLNMCLPDPLCVAADVLQEYITIIENSGTLRDYRSLRRDYWYGRFNLIRDKEKFAHQYGHVFKNIKDLEWALTALDTYNATQPVVLSPAFICGKARSLYYAKNNVGNKEGGSPRRRMLDIVTPLLDARAPYKVIATMVDVVAVRKEHIGNYSHWFEFYKNYTNVVNRKTEGCFDEALSVVTNEFYRGYDSERHVDAKRVEYNRFGIELPDPHRIQSEDTTIYLNSTSFKEQQEILEKAQNEIIEDQSSPIIELPKIQGPYSAYLESKGMAKDQESNFSIKFNFKKSSPAVLVIDSPIKFPSTEPIIQEPSKKKTRKKKESGPEVAPDGLIGAFMLAKEQLKALTKQMKILETMLTQSGHEIKDDSVIEPLGDINPVVSDDDEDEEEDTRDYSEFEATLVEPTFPQMTDAEYKEKTILAIDQEETYGRMTPEERNKFWVLKDHLAAETKRRNSL